jgi:hypothetical protein
MELKQVLKELDIPAEYTERLAVNWEKSEASYTGKLHFTRHEFYEKYYALTENQDNLLPLLDEVAAKINSSEALKMLSWHAHCVLCDYPAEDMKFIDWPEMDNIFGENCGMYYLLIGLSIIPRFIETFKKNGIPEKYGKDCCKWLNGTVYIYKSAHNGYPGHTRQQLHWMRHYLEGKLFRIGRFEYMNQILDERFPTVMRHKHDGQIIALCNSGWGLDKNGFRLYYDQDITEAAFVTELQETESEIIGTPISPCGYALNSETVRLCLSEWEKVLAPGDFAPGIHIPGGGKMNLETCGESFNEAIDFYKRYFPDKEAKAFVCGSWIFNTDFEEELPESNLAKLMQELYLFPMQSSGIDGLFFIFGKSDGDYKDYPRDNSVRRAMMNIIDSGKRLKVGGMFILTDDLDKFGTQQYRKQRRQ